LECAECILEYGKCDGHCNQGKVIEVVITHVDEKTKTITVERVKKDKEIKS
jgi:hypothetical protein